MQTNVSLDIDDAVAYLTFACDAPGKPNTLDHAVLEQLDHHLVDLEAAASSLIAVVVRSAAAKYFIVGANIRALQTLDSGTIGAWIEHGHRVFTRLEGLPLPVIARVEGYALGGGLELALACDLILASSRAVFGQPEARLGFVAGWGGTFRLPRRVGPAKAKELLFTGRTIDAATAARIGLVDYAGDPAGLDAHLTAMLDDIRHGSAHAVAQMKRLVNENLGGTAEQARHTEAVASHACIEHPETKTRIATFLAGRAG